MLNVEVGAAIVSEPHMLLKTIRALTRPIVARGSMAEPLHLDQDYRHRVSRHFSLPMGLGPVGVKEVARAVAQVSVTA